METILPHDEKAYKFLVEIYTKTDRPDEAVKAYDRWIKISPEKGILYRDAGVLLAYELGRYVEALHYWEKALEYFPEDPQASKIRSEISRFKAKAAPGDQESR